MELKILLLALILIASCSNKKEISITQSVIDFESGRISKLVDQYWQLDPVTVTQSVCDRSKGGKHDFYSEGDYWWPDPKNPEGPYARRDGLSNPDNFSAHRLSMIQFSRIVGALTSQWLLTGDDKYGRKALEHLNAWFVNPETRMNPNLLYAQAIRGRFSGRGIGIIDALHLVEVARSAYLLQNVPGANEAGIGEVKKWFGELLHWMHTHEYGIDEMLHPNNHGTCWAVQVAAYAQLSGNQSMLNFCYERFKNVLLPGQMALNGSFTLELERTKPYGYSLFNLDAMCLLVHILSQSGYPDVWNYRLPDGRGIQKGMEFMFPYIINKSEWTYQPDVMYWESWPVSQPALVLSAIAFDEKKYFEAWIKLDHDPETNEVQRNLVMRYPLIWLHNSNLPTGIK